MSDAALNRGVSDYLWSDIDGDQGTLSADPADLGPDTGPALCFIELRDVEMKRDVAVYIEPHHAREIIAWLEDRLKEQT